MSSAFASVTLLVAFLINHVLAVPDVRPALTAAYGQGGMNIGGFSPLPTGLPNSSPRELFRRDLPNPTCGYVSADIYTPLTCYSNEFCGVRTDLGVIGCCTSYSQLANGQFTLTGCTFRTVCYDSTAASSCVGTCLSNTLAGFCTNSLYPYCMTYTYTQAALSYYRCRESPNIVTQVALTYTVPKTTSSASVTSTSTTPSVGVGTTISATATPTDGSDQSQNQAASNVTQAGGEGGLNASVSPTPSVLASSSGSKSILGPVVGGAVGGFAVIVGAIALGVFFCLRHKKNKKAVTQQAANNSAYAANHEYKPDLAAENKGPEPFVATMGRNHEYKTSLPTNHQQYQTPYSGASELSSPSSRYGQSMSPPPTEIQGRAFSPTPHSTRLSELGAPNMSAQAGPTSGWNRPYHELE